MNKKNIAVVGANGKMGKLTCKILNNKYKVTEITLENSLLDFNDIDFVIDFASANSSIKSAKYCYDKNIPILIASTGQTPKQLKKLYEYSKKIPMMICSNLSIGIAKIKKMLENFDFPKKCNVTIIEKHHIEKKDSPSGTALNLKRFLEKKLNKSIEILSERGGKEIGTHTIDIYFNDELISITHKAFSRNCFAEGAMLATDFLITQTKPGLFDFEKIL